MQKPHPIGDIMIARNWKKICSYMLCMALVFGHCWREDPGLDRPLVWPSLALEHDCMFCVTCL